MLEQTQSEVRTPLICSLAIGSREDCAALGLLLEEQAPLLDAAHAGLATVSVLRLTILPSQTQLALIAEFSGTFEQCSAELAEHCGAILDRLFQHVVAPPVAPIAEHVAEFREWARAHDLPQQGHFGSAPDATELDDADATTLTVALAAPRARATRD